MKLINVIEISRFLENEVCFDIACHECDERLKAVCHFVNQRPADYDIDKVVEQLEELNEEEERFVNNHVFIQGIIEIVKSGGKE